MYLSPTLAAVLTMMMALKLAAVACCAAESSVPKAMVPAGPPP